MTELPTYVLDRDFNAPRALVWRAWTDPALLPRWYGPNVVTLVRQHDLRPGGLWLNEMQWGGNSHYERIEYTEVQPTERLVWHHSMADANWGVISNPQMQDWPRVLLTTVTLTADGERTHMRLTWVPFEASAGEIACFAGAIGNLGRGWEAGMQLMDELLVELQA